MQEETNEMTCLDATWQKKTRNVKGRPGHVGGSGCVTAALDVQQRGGSGLRRMPGRPGYYCNSQSRKPRAEVQSVTPGQSESEAQAFLDTGPSAHSTLGWCAKGRPEGHLPISEGWEKGQRKGLTDPQRRHTM